MEVERLTFELVELQKKYDDARVEIEDLERNRDKFKKELSDEKEAHCNERRKSQAQGERIKELETLQKNNTSIIGPDSQDGLKNAQVELTNFQRLVDGMRELQKEYNDQRILLIEATKQLNEVSQKLEDNNNEIETLTEEKEKSLNIIASLRDDVNKLESDLTKVQTDCDKYKSEYNNLERQIKSLKNDYNTLLKQYQKEKLESASQIRILQKEKEELMKNSKNESEKKISFEAYEKIKKENEDMQIELDQFRSDAKLIIKWVDENLMDPGRDSGQKKTHDISTSEVSLLQYKNANLQLEYIKVSKDFEEMKGRFEKYCHDNGIEVAIQENNKLRDDMNTILRLNDQFKLDNNHLSIKCIKLNQYLELLEKKYNIPYSDRDNFLGSEDQGDNFIEAEIEGYKAKIDQLEKMLEDQDLMNRRLRIQIFDLASSNAKNNMSQFGLNNEDYELVLEYIDSLRHGDRSLPNNMSKKKLIEENFILKNQLRLKNDEYFSVFTEIFNDQMGKLTGMVGDLNNGLVSRTSSDAIDSDLNELSRNTDKNNTTEYDPIHTNDDHQDITKVKSPRLLGDQLRSPSSKLNRQSSQHSLNMTKSIVSHIDHLEEKIDSVKRETLNYIEQLYDSKRTPHLKRLLSPNSSNTPVYVIDPKSRFPITVKNNISPNIQQNIDKNINEDIPIGEIGQKLLDDYNLDFLDDCDEVVKFEFEQVLYQIIYCCEELAKKDQLITEIKNELLYYSKDLTKFIDKEILLYNEYHELRKNFHDEKEVLSKKVQSLEEENDKYKTQIEIYHRKCDTISGPDDLKRLYDSTLSELFESEARSFKFYRQYEHLIVQLKNESDKNSDLLNQNIQQENMYKHRILYLELWKKGAIESLFLYNSLLDKAIKYEPNKELDSLNDHLQRILLSYTDFEKDKNESLILKSSLRELESRIIKLSAENVKYENDIKKLNTIISEHKQSTKSGASNSINLSFDQIVELKSDLMRSELKNSEKDSQIGSLNNFITELNKDISEISRELNDAKEELRKSNNELKELATVQSKFISKLANTVPLEDKNLLEIELERAKEEQYNLTIECEKYKDINKELNIQIDILQTLKQCHNDELYGLTRTVSDIYQNSLDSSSMEQIISHAEKLEGYQIIQYLKDLKEREIGNRDDALIISNLHYDNTQKSVQLKKVHNELKQTKLLLRHKDSDLKLLEQKCDTLRFKLESQQKSFFQKEQTFIKVLDNYRIGSGNSRIDRITRRIEELNTLFSDQGESLSKLIQSQVLLENENQQLRISLQSSNTELEGLRELSTLPTSSNHVIAAKLIRMNEVVRITKLDKLKAQSELKSIQNEQTKILERINSKEKEIEKLMKQIILYESEMTDHQIKTINNRLEEITTNEKENADKMIIFDTISNKELVNLKYQHISQDIGSIAEQETDTLVSQLKECNQKINELEDENHNLHERIGKSDRTITDLQSELREFKSANGDLTLNIQKLFKNKEMSTNSNNVFNQIHQEKVANNEMAKGTITNLNRIIEDKNLLITQYQEKISKLHELIKKEKAKVYDEMKIKIKEMENNLKLEYDMKLKQQSPIASENTNYQDFNLQLKECVDSNIKLLDQIKELQLHSDLYQDQLNVLTSENHLLKQEKEDIQYKINIYQEEIDKLKGNEPEKLSTAMKIKKCKNYYQKKIKELKESHHSEIEKNEMKIKQLEREVTLIKIKDDQIISLQKEIDKMSKNKTMLEDTKITEKLFTENIVKIRDMEGNVINNKIQMKTLIDNTTQLENEVANYRKKVNESEKQIINLENQNQKLKNQLDQTNRELNQSRNMIQMNQRNQLNESKLDNFKESKISDEVNLAPSLKQTDNLEELKKQICRLEIQIKTYQNATQNSRPYHSQLSEKTGNSDRLLKQNKILNTKIIDLQNKLDISENTIIEARSQIEYLRKRTTIQPTKDDPNTIKISNKLVDDLKLQLEDIYSQKDKLYQYELKIHELEKENNLIKQQSQNKLDRQIELYKEIIENLTVENQKLKKIVGEIPSSTPSGLDSNRVSQLTEKLQQSQNKIIELENQLILTKYEYDHNNVEFDKLKSRVNDLESYRESMRGLHCEIPEQRKAGERYQPSRDVEKVIDSLKTQIERQKREIESLKSGSIGAKDYYDLKKEYDILQASYNEQAKECENYKNKIANMVSTKNMSKFNNLSSQRSEISTIDQQKLLTQYQNDISKLQKKINSLEIELNQANNLILQKDKDIKKNSISATPNIQKESIDPSIIQKQQAILSEVESEKKRIIQDLNNKISQLESQLTILSNENSQLKKELSAFDVEFFDEIEDIKYKYQQATKREEKYKEHLKTCPYTI